MYKPQHIDPISPKTQQLYKAHLQNLQTIF